MMNLPNPANLSNKRQSDPRRTRSNTKIQYVTNNGLCTLKVISGVFKTAWFSLCVFVVLVDNCFFQVYLSQVFTMTVASRLNNSALASKGADINLVDNGGSWFISND
jgi:hypothetical protein